MSFGRVNAGTLRVLALLLLPMVAACHSSPSPVADLAGAWRANVKFADGALEPIGDLQFLYAFNVGGTLTESSNYDGSPPVPPAYGIWHRTGPHNFVAKYEFFITKPPTAFNDIATGGGWTPSGRGVLEEVIVLADDEKTYRSTISYVALDQSGKVVAGGGKGFATGTRISF